MQHSFSNQTSETSGMFFSSRLFKFVGISVSKLLITGM